MAAPYVPLRIFSCYTMLEGAIEPKAIAKQAKTLDAVKLAHALEGFKLPPEVALMPGTPYYRAEDHQLVPSAFVGHLQSKGTSDPEDLFVVDQVLNGAETAPPASETGCKLSWPA